MGSKAELARTNGGSLILCNFEVIHRQLLLLLLLRVAGFNSRFQTAVEYLVDTSVTDLTVAARSSARVLCPHH